MRKIKLTDLPKLHTATKEPIQLHGTIFFHLHIGDMTAGVWINYVSNLIVDMLLGTSFIDRFTRDTFFRDLKVVPWYSQPDAIIESSHRGVRTDRAPIPRKPTWHYHSSKPSTTIAIYSVHIARQRVIPPNSEKATVATPNAS